MNRTEQMEVYKKEVFKIDLALRMKHYKDSAEHRNLLKEKQLLLRKMEALNEELSMADGQVGFAFDDLIEIPEKKDEGVKYGKF